MTPVCIFVATFVLFLTLDPTAGTMHSSGGNAYGRAFAAHPLTSGPSMRPGSLRYAVPVLTALCVVVTGCSGPSAGDHKKIIPTYNPKTGRLTRLAYDSNGDGRIDTWAYMDGPKVLRIEISTHHDGKIDRWEYYGGNDNLTKVAISRANDGKPDEWMFEGADHLVSRIELSTHHDGKVDRWEYYKDGLLTRVELDTNGDGHVDQWETYKDGRMTSVEFDTRHTGKPDRRLLYTKDGKATVEVDPTGTGHWQPIETAHGH